MRAAGPADDPGDLPAAVRAARDGDENAFRVLYREVQPGLLRYLRGLVGEDAEDVASDAWLQIARDIRSFRNDGAGFPAWAARIARNRAFDHLRRHRRRPIAPVPTELFVDLAETVDTADEAITADATRAAIALISTLPRDQAEAILLRVVVGLDAEAAARVLGKRPGAVRTAAWRGLRRLAAQLDTHTHDPEVRHGHGSASPKPSGDAGGADTRNPWVTQPVGQTPEKTI